MRALAHGESDVRGFSDPVAEVLLSPGYRWLLDRIRRTRHRETRFWRRFREESAPGMSLIPLRTVFIDEAVRSWKNGDQVVLLGAGLDGRAWRMPELTNATVFEVDHPATQGYKRSKTQGLRPAAREVRFVAVDFGRDVLEERLEAAGHRADAPTLWIWEGVIDYLPSSTVASTLRRIRMRSAAGSRLVAGYRSDGRDGHVVGDFLWRVLARSAGEPFRSRFSPEKMRRTLNEAGFEVEEDTSAADWIRRYAEGLTAAKGGRLGTASRVVVAR